MTFIFFVFAVFIILVLIGLTKNEVKEPPKRETKKEFWDRYHSLGSTNKKVQSSSSSYETPQFYNDKPKIDQLQERKIDSIYLRPKKDAIDDNMFYGKKVVITGEFKAFPNRNKLAELLWLSGADIDHKVTERIDYMIVGFEPGWRKMELIEEYEIQTFSEKEILKIFSTV